MDTAIVQDEAFKGKAEREVGGLAGLKELDDWYTRRQREVSDSAGPEAERQAALLREVYLHTVAVFLGRAAAGLADPQSDAHREVVEKFDATWRELASR